MAYDEKLAERVRDVLSVRENFSERKMFGGIGFMLRRCRPSSRQSQGPPAPV